MLNTDDLISMHKACEKVIEDMAMIDRGVSTFSSAHERIDTIRDSVTALAIIQRDLIKTVLAD